MNYIDVAIIAVIAFFALMGLWKGTAKTFIKLICFVIAIVCAYLISSAVMEKVLSVGFIKKFIVGDKLSLYSLYYKALPAEVAYATVEPAVPGALGLFVKPMIKRFTLMGGPSAYGITYGQFIAINLSIHTLSIVLTAVIYGIVRVVAHIVAWILKKIFVHGKPRGASRIVGFVLGAVRGFAIVAVLLVISTAIFPMKFGFAKAYTSTFEDSLIGKKTASFVYKGYDKLVYGDDEDEVEDFLEELGFEEIETPAPEDATPVPETPTPETSTPETPTPEPEDTTPVVPLE